jgi:hypothetical protein
MRDRMKAQRQLWSEVKGVCDGGFGSVLGGAGMFSYTARHGAVPALRENILDLPIRPGASASPGADYRKRRYVADAIAKVISVICSSPYANRSPGTRRREGGAHFLS